MQRSVAMATADKPLFEGRLWRKKPKHGRFEDAYTIRVHCWIAAAQDGVCRLYLCPSAAKAGPPAAHELAGAERLGLSACVVTRKHSRSRKFMLRERDGDLDVRLRADTATECVKWLMHLKQAQDLTFAAGSRTAEEAGARAQECAQSGLLREPSEVYCCVCLGPYTDQVTAGCSHSFCADCIVRVCLSTPSDGPVRGEYMCAWRDACMRVPRLCPTVCMSTALSACVRHAILSLDCVCVCTTTCI